MVVQSTATYLLLICRKNTCEKGAGRGGRGPGASSYRGVHAWPRVHDSSETPASRPVTDATKDLKTAELPKGALGDSCCLVPTRAMSRGGPDARHRNVSCPVPIPRPVSGRRRRCALSSARPRLQRRAGAVRLPERHELRGRHRHPADVRLATRLFGERADGAGRGESGRSHMGSGLAEHQQRGPPAHSVRQDAVRGQRPRARARARHGLDLPADAVCLAREPSPTIATAGAGQCGFRSLTTFTWIGPRFRRGKKLGATEPLILRPQ